MLCYHVGIHLRSLRLSKPCYTTTVLGAAGRIYVTHDVEIDTGQVVVLRAGLECRLRPKTFRLLVYLIEHRDRLVPKAELIEQLWPDVAVSDSALAQCIADIRRALG